MSFRWAKSLFILCAGRFRFLTTHTFDILIGDGWQLNDMEKYTSLEDILLFVNKTFVTLNERSFPRGSNLSAVLDINVESNPLSNNMLIWNVFSPFETFISSTCKCVTLFSLALWLILLQLSELLFVKVSFILILFELTFS